MDVTQQRALEASGWKIGDAADFLGMDEEELQLLNARVEIALAVRRQREANHLSQKELGKRLQTTQPRVARIERAANDVSLDQLVRALAAAGGSIVVRVDKSKARKGAPGGKRSTGDLVLNVVTTNGSTGGDTSRTKRARSSD